MGQSYPTSESWTYLLWRPVRPIHSAGRRRERVGAHARSSYGTRRLERGTTFSTSGCTTVDNEDQANILINQSRRACLADFGLSTIVGTGYRASANASLISVASTSSLTSSTSGETTRWMSPELLDPGRFGITDYRPTKQSDCYALGMVVYEVRTDYDRFHLHNGLTCVPEGSLRERTLSGHHKPRCGEECDYER
jgi:hypothetical protein